MGKTPEYKILVNAVPQIKGVPAIYGQKIPNITDSSNFNANYPISVVNFEFSANGDLVYFQMTSPFEIAEIINENVAILSLDSLIEKAKSHLILSDASAGYGLPDGLVNMYEEIIQEKLVCKIEICDIQFGLGRARVAENNTGYCYVPVFVCKGKADYYGKDSEQLYISSANYGSELHNLVWINAVDGTIFAG